MMHSGARTLRAMPATLALCALLAAFAGASPLRAQELAERDFLDGSEAVDSLVQPTRPTQPPLPYVSPLATIYATADLVGLTRSHASGNFAATGPGRIALSGHDFDFAFQPGMRLLLGARLTDYAALEASYFGLFDWNEQRSVTNGDMNILGTNGNLFSPFSNFGQAPQGGLDFNYFIDVQVETQFNSGEINLRRRIDLPYSTAQASMIFGTRYLDVKDRFQYRSQSLIPNPAGTLITDVVDTNNRMLGPQIGGALELNVAPRGWLNIETKGAMLFNEASQSTLFTRGPLAGPGTSVYGTRSDQRLAFAADVQATLCWKFTRAIVGRVGYQAVFIEGLALGSENFGQNAANVLVDPSQLVKDGNTVFHGPFTGLTITW